MAEFYYRNIQGAQCNIHVCIAEGQREEVLDVQLLYWILGCLVFIFGDGSTVVFANIHMK